MVDDTLAERLAAIARRGNIAYNDYDAPPRRDFDGLVAAVEAAVALAARWERFGDGQDAQSECAAELRSAITRELPREDGT